MSQQYIFPIIAIAVSLTVGIFRNQLSKIGDNLSANNWRLVIRGFVIIVQYGVPLYLIYLAFKDDAFDKTFVLKTAFLVGVIILQLALEVGRYFTRAKISSEMTYLRLKNSASSLDVQREKLQGVIDYWKSKDPTKENIEKI